MNHLSENVPPPPLKSSFYPTFFLCLLVGGFGIHRFYTGKIRSGLLQLVTLGGCGVWWLVDMVLLLQGKFTDKDNQTMANVNPKLTWPLFVVVLIIGFSGGIGGLGSNASTASTRASGSARSSTPNAEADKPAEARTSVAQERAGVYLCQSPATTLRLEKDGGGAMMMNGNPRPGHWKLISDQVIEFKPDTAGASRFAVRSDGSLEEMKYGYKFEKLPSR